MKRPMLPSGRSRPGLPLAGWSDRARLIFLAVLLIVFGGGYFYLRHDWARQREKEQDEAAYIADEDRSDIVRDPAAKIDFSILEQVRDGSRNERLIREPEPYSHLLAEARKLTPGDLEALGLKPMDADAISADPGVHRGLPYEVKGFLESIEVVQGQLWQEIRGTIRDQQDRYYTFSVLREPDVTVGQVVRLSGFFFKLFSLEAKPGEYLDNVIHLVGKSLDRSFLAMAPTEDLAEVPFHLARDFDLTEMVELQEELLYQVLNHVRGLSANQKSELTAQDVTWTELRRDPDAWRGKTVRILARYAPGLEWPRKLGPGGENPLEVKYFQDGILALPRNRLVRWIGFEPFPKELLGQTKLTYLTGVFVKNYAWENNRQDILNGPLLVPIRFEPFQMPKNEVFHRIGYGIAGITLLLLILFFVGVFRDSRRSKAFRREFLRRKKNRLDRVLADENEPSRPPDVPAGR